MYTEDRGTRTPPGLKKSVEKLLNAAKELAWADEAKNADCADALVRAAMDYYLAWCDRGRKTKVTVDL